MTLHIKVFFLMFYLFSGIASTYFYLKINEFTVSKLWSIYIIYILIACSIFILEKKLLSWGKIIGLSFFLYSLSIPLYILTGGEIQEIFNMNIIYTEIYDIKLNIQFVLLCIVFLSSFYFSYTLFSKKYLVKLPNLYSKKENTYNYSYSKLFIAMWLLLGVFLFLGGINKIGYISAITGSYSLSNEGYVYIFSGVFAIDIGFLILLGLSRFEKKYLFISLIFHCLVLPLGIRQMTMMYIAQIILLYVFVNKVNISFYIKKYLFFIVILFWTFGVIGNLRGKNLHDFTFMDFILGPLKFYMYETTFNALSILKMINMTNNFNLDYIYGKSLIDPFVTLIPSFILPNKGEFNSFDIFMAKYSTIDNLKPVGTAHLLTELIANGGMLFLIGFSIGLGVIAAIMQKKTVRYLDSNNIIGLIFISSVIPYVIIQLNRGGIDILIKLIVQFSLIPILIVLVFRKKKSLSKVSQNDLQLENINNE